MIHGIVTSAVVTLNSTVLPTQKVAQSSYCYHIIVDKELKSGLQD
jgi:hypothetical protein